MVRKAMVRKAMVRKAMVTPAADEDRPRETQAMGEAKAAPRPGQAAAPLKRSGTDQG